jgi:hypothetical protein
MRVPLQIPPGVDLDDTSFLSKGRWKYVDKCRFWQDQLQVIGGWTGLNVSVTGVCRGVMAWQDNSLRRNIAFGTHSNLQVFRDGQLYDITPTGLTPGRINGVGGLGYSVGPYSDGVYSGSSTSVDLKPRTWALSTYGETLIANPSGQTIYQWSNNENNPAVAITNAPDQVIYSLTAPTRQVLAFGCNEEVSGDFNPMAIRFSDIEDITDWTTSPTNNAGEVILEAGGTTIVCARLVGDYVLVWTDTALFQGYFTGNTAQPWVFNRVGDHCGSIGPNAVVVVGQTSYWLSKSGQFYVYAFGSEPQMIPSSIQPDVTNNIALNQDEKVYAASISEFGEVWWQYPDARDGNENSRYVSLSTVGQGPSQGIMARSAFLDADPLDYPVGVDPDGPVYYHENGNSANGSPLSWEAETADQYIGEADQIMMLKGVWPDIKDQIGPLMLSVTTRSYPQSPERTRGPYVIQPNRFRRDFRIQARIMRVKLEAASAPTYARLGKMEFDVEGTGLR